LQRNFKIFVVELLLSVNLIEVAEIIQMFHNLMEEAFKSSRSIVNSWCTVRKKGMCCETFLRHYAPRVYVIIQSLVRFDAIPNSFMCHTPLSGRLAYSFVMIVHKCSSMTGAYYSRNVLH
jgi:hypothetical protein